MASAGNEDGRVELGFESAARRRQVWEWLGAGLRPGRPGRLQQEYPLLFSPDASSLHLTFYREDAPVAFCALWPARFRLGSRRLSAGLVSLVYTDPESRGQGHASRIVRAAIDHAGRLGLGLVMLWSELESFYSRLGFTRVGCESLVLVDPERIDRALETLGGASDRLHLEIPSEADWSEIERMRGARDCQLELDAGLLARMRGIPDMSVRVARDADCLRGFAIRGRGDDLAEIIHDWGGDPQAALLCCRSLVEAWAPHRELLMLSPSERCDPAWALRRAGAAVVRQPVAWMRIASTRTLARELGALLPGDGVLEILDDSTDEPASTRLRLRSDSGETQVEAGTLLTALFGSDRGVDPGDCARRLAPALDEVARAALPLPFFVWGLESI